MFPPDDKKEKGKPESKGKPPAKGGGPPPPGQGAQQNLHHPPAGLPKAGQGINPMQAMTQGMGDLSALGPPPPPSPGAPMGPNGMPVGGQLPSSDPMVDPSMDGSGLFQALNMQLDPMGGQSLQDPSQGDPQMGLEQLLEMLAMSQAGAMPGQGPPGGMGSLGGALGGMGGRLNPSGIMNDPTMPGQTMGLNPFNVIQ